MKIETIYGKLIESSQTSNVPKNQLDSTRRIKVVGCCKTCLNGEFKKRENPICDEHFTTIFINVRIVYNFIYLKNLKN